MKPALPLSGETVDAINRVEGANSGWLRDAMAVFTSGLLADEFSSSDIAEALIDKMKVPKPSDWRVMGALTRRAVALRIIEPTGNLDTRRSITGHTSNHAQPTYRKVRRQTDLLTLLRMHEEKVNRSIRAMK